MAEEFADHPRPHLFDLARRQGGKGEGTIGQANQPVDLEADRFQHLADLAVLALGEGDADPEVGTGGTLPGLVDHRLDRAVTDAFHRYTGLEGIQPVLGDPAEGAGPVAADQARGGEFQCPGHAPVVGEEEQALCRKVETADGNQSRKPGRKRLEDGRATLGIVVRGHQARGLVVAEQADRLCVGDHFSVHGQYVTRVDPDRGGVQCTAVQRDPALGDQALDLAAGGDAGTGQGLGDALAAALRGLTFAAGGGS